MKTDHGNDVDDSTEDQQQQASSSQAGGPPPPIVLTSQLNLIQSQRQLRGLLKGNFEFRSTRNGTTIVTKEMAGFLAIPSHFESNYLPYFTFCPKSQKPIQAVIRHLPFTTPAEDISDGLVDIGFDVIRVKKNVSHPSITCGRDIQSKPSPLPRNLT
jgi:hypothetical protein